MMQQARLRVLVVEDNPNDYQLLLDTLAACPSAGLELTPCQRLGEAVEVLRADAFDAVLLDLGLPDSQGLDTLVRLVRSSPALPVVVLTVLDDESVGLEAVRKGAQDYLLKGDIGPQLLIRSLRYAIERKRGEERLEKQREEMEKEARQRTADLVEANQLLRREVERRQAIEEVLSEREAHYRILADNVTDVIWTADLDLHFTYVSPSVTSLLGYRVAELMAMRRREVFPVESLERALQAIAQRLAGEGEGRVSPPRSLNLELELKRKDGSTVWTDTRFTFLRDRNGRPKELLAITRDISEARRTRLEVQRNYETHRALNSLLTLALEEMPLDDLLAKALDLLLSLPWLTMESKGAIFLVESEAETLVMKAQGGLAEPIRQACARIPFGSCLCGRAAATGEIVFSSHVDQRREVRHDGMQSHGHYCIPLTLGGEVMGLLNLYLREGHQPPEGERDFLNAYANVLAVAIGRRKAEEALRNSELRLRSFLGRLPDPVVVYDMEGRVLFVNHGFETTFGWTKGELLHGKIDFVPPESWPETLANIERMKRGESVLSFETKRLTKDGRKLDVLINTATFLEEGKQKGNIVAFRDVSEIKRAENALRESEERYRMLVEAITEGLIMGDENGVLSFYNQRFCDMLGYDCQELRGKNVFDLVDAPNRELMARQRERRRQGLEDSYELAWTKKDGGQAFTIVSAKGVFNNYGHYKGFLALITNITERKILEAQLLQAQKLEAIGQLAAGIAHEINTPTQYVSDNSRFLRDSLVGLVSLLGKYGLLANQARESGLFGELVADIEAESRQIDLDYLIEEIPKSIEQSLDGLERISKIVRSMKEFAHPGPAAMTAVDINKAIENTVTVARNEWKYVAEMETDLDPDLPLVPCFPGEINQVILNIIVNAAHAIADANKESPDRKGTIRVSTQQVGGQVEIRVSDTGLGIPEKILTRIFDPFFTTKEPGKGTGQGLAIAHSVIVDKHKGKLSFITKENEGTTFIITLPLDGQA